MKSKLFLGLLIIALVGLFFHPGCKIAESCLYTIQGTWNVDINAVDLVTVFWTEILTFSGSETGGTVLGWTYESGVIGTYTVISCSVVQILYNYIDSWYGQTNILFYGNLTSDIYMGGSGTWYDEDLGYTTTFTWNATRF